MYVVPVKRLMRAEGGATQKPQKLKGNSMSVKSMFDFKFPAEHADEGVAIAHAVGADMTAKAGYIDHEVIRDVKDSGHVMVNTHWESEDAANAVLTPYQHDDKIAQATKLIGSAPSGFVGEVGR